MPRRLRELFAALALGTVGPAWADSIEVLRAHSRLVEAAFDVGTIAVGDSSLVRATAITPRRVLVNGVRNGATSLIFIGKKGEIAEHRVHVVHDLAALRQQMQGLDTRIRVTSDPNRNAIVLSGLVRSESQRRRALDVALSFVGNTQYRVAEAAVALRPSAPASSPGEPAAQADATDDETGPAAAEQAGPAAAPTGVARDARAVITAERVLEEGAPQVVDLLNTDEQLRPATSRLQDMLRAIDRSLQVTEHGSVVHASGSVDHPAQLARALNLIENFVTDGNQQVGALRAFSDRGGVLVTELDARDDDASRGLLSTSGAGGSRRRGNSVDRVFGGTSASISPSARKGNIVQNLSRADTVVIAGGRALSLITVREQPRVEVQVRIVSVDRDATEQLGINWRLDGSRVSIGSFTGGVTDTLPSGGASGEFGSGGSGTGTGTGGGSGSDTIDVGAANLVGLFRIGSTMSISAFLQAVEQTGAGTSLSEPLLTAVSGERVSFLVGGEVPIPVGSTSISTNSVIGGSTTTTDTTLLFREFGIQLHLRPTVLEDGRISLVLDQSISQPNFTSAVTVGGAVVPSFSRRSVQTLTESADGETWAVAGLLTQEDTERLQQVPFLGDIPWLGKLFQRKDNRKTRSELIITVTARKVPLPRRQGAAAAEAGS